MKKLLLAASVLLFSASAYSQCTTWLNPPPPGGFTNFNDQFGGAPCSTTPPVTNEITGFEIWAAEAYSMANIRAGGSYTFSACNGPGAGTWVPVFTILNPTGGVVAFGRNPGSTCALSFTALVTGTYIIVVNQAGSTNCGSGPNTAVNNGFPAIRYNGGATCSAPVTTCEAGTYVGAATQSLCPGAEGTVSASGVIIPNSPTIGTQVVIFTPSASGSGATGGRFFLTGVTLPYTFDNDLSGVLSFNGLPPLVGQWTMRPGVSSTNAVVTLCDSTAAASQVTFLNSGAPGCAPFVCEAGNTTASNQNICPGGDWSLTLAGEILPVPGDVLWFFLDTNDTSGNNDYVYDFGSDPTFYNFVGDLNGALAAASLDTIPPGTYLTFAGIFNPADSTICDVTDNEFFIRVRPATAAQCGGTTPCTLPYPVVTGLAAANQANGVLLTWNPIPGSLGCRIQGGLASGGPLQEFQVIQPNLSQFFVPQSQLVNGLTYRARVRCGCSLTVGGAYSPFVNFTRTPPGPAGLVQNDGPSRLEAEATGALAKDNVEGPAFRNILNTSGIFYNSLRPVSAEVKSKSGAYRNYFNSSNAGKVVTGSMTIFPNPSNGEFTVTFKAVEDGNVSARVYDALGKVVYSQNISTVAGNNQTNLDLSSFEAGMYMIEIIENGLRSTQRIVLTK